jgi:hypothetical protein
MEELQDTCVRARHDDIRGDSKLVLVERKSADVTA